MNTQTLSDRERSLILAYAEKELKHALWLVQERHNPNHYAAIAEAFRQVAKRYSDLAEGDR